MITDKNTLISNSEQSKLNIQFTLLDKDKIVEVFERFKKQNNNPVTELIAPNEYCLLVSVVLSAQATDKSVNAATKKLFEVVTDPYKMISLGKNKLIQYIKSIGLFNTKAEHIIALSKKLVSDYNGNLPEYSKNIKLVNNTDIERVRQKLMSLSGVGRKTANVMLNVVYGAPTMPVDTHLLRICPKIGLAQGTTPLEVEESLIKRIPKKYLEHAHHWLILHGRYVCTARNPKCNNCLISDLCCYNNK